MTIMGTLYIISAPSGGGKTSLVNALVSTVAKITVSVSYTTRVKRPGEEDGVNYHFVTKEHFEQLIVEGAFVEYAQVFGNYYGTGRQWVDQKLASGEDVILEIDWQGAKQIRQLMPASVGVFILPPSREVLYSRLRERAQDDAKIIEGRMALASNEISHYQEYDYLIVNDDFFVALTDLQAIIQARRLMIGPQQQRHNQLIKNLL